jgi:hypothetical protein
VSTTELIEIIKALPRAERARVAEFVEQLDTDPKPKKRSNRDLTILNRRAARLNREAADVLDFQISLRSAATSIASRIQPAATLAVSAYSLL